LPFATVAGHDGLGLVDGVGRVVLEVHGHLDPASRIAREGRAEHREGLDVDPAIEALPGVKHHLLAVCVDLQVERARDVQSEESGRGVGLTGVAGCDGDVGNAEVAEPDLVDQHQAALTNPVGRVQLDLRVGGTRHDAESSEGRSRQRGVGGAGVEHHRELDLVTALPKDHGHRHSSPHALVGEHQRVFVGGEGRSMVDGDDWLGDLELGTG
jgi:hypothetical protein